MISPPE